MPIRKKGNIEVKTSPNGYGIKRTGYTFYSYDKNSAALYFEFNDQNGQPTDLKKATVRLVMILNDDDKKNASVTTKAEIISELRGTAKYDIPESLLGYEGKVTGYVYLEFEDGSHTDEGKFTFNIKRSMISNVLPEAGGKYVQDFEDVKERVEQAGDSATKDISSSASDVKSKASEANEDISGLVKTTEDARDNAVKTMNEIDYSDRNLLKGTSNEWKLYSFRGWTEGHFTYTLEELGLSVGDTITYSAKFDNTKDDNNDASVNVMVSFYDKDGEWMNRISGNAILSGEIGLSYVTNDIPEGTTKINAISVNKSENGNQKIVAAKEYKLQFGTRATAWTPAPEDIVLKSEMEKIKQAIINLGGSI